MFDFLLLSFLHATPKGFVFPPGIKPGIFHFYINHYSIKMESTSKTANLAQMCLLTSRMLSDYPILSRVFNVPKFLLS